MQSIYVLRPTGPEKLGDYAGRSIDPGELLWLNFAGNIDQTRHWLLREKLLAEMHVDALCSELTRPRLYVDADRNLMLTLRTPRETPEPPLDFLSLRVWASPNLIVTVTRWPTDLVDVFVEGLRHQSPPPTAVESLLLALCQYFTDEFTDAINALDDQVIALEDMWDETLTLELDRLTEARQRLSRISRYLPPQLEAMQKLAQHVDERELPKALKRSYQDSWREVTNGVRRDIEALTEMRERLMILQDNLQQRASERISRTMYLLTLLSTFFLPLTFVAGLLGMNVAGIPASDYPLAFWFVCGLMGVIALIQWTIFRRWQWLG